MGGWWWGSREALWQQQRQCSGSAGRPRGTQARPGRAGGPALVKPQRATRTRCCGTSWTSVLRSFSSGSSSRPPHSRPTTCGGRRSRHSRSSGRGVKTHGPGLRSAVHPPGRTHSHTPAHRCHTQGLPDGPHPASAPPTGPPLAQLTATQLTWWVSSSISARPVVTQNSLPCRDTDTSPSSLCRICTYRGGGWEGRWAGGWSGWRGWVGERRSRAAEWGRGQRVRWQVGQQRGAGAGGVAK